MNKSVAQAMPVARAIVVAIHRETGDQWMVNRIAIIAVALVFLIMGCLVAGRGPRWENCRRRWWLALRRGRTSTGTAQVAVYPIKETKAKGFAPLY